MTLPLSDLQNWMHKALIHPNSAAPRDLQDRIAPNARLSTQETLAIYQRSYGLRIASCMREQFPALCHALGEGLFNDFVAEYVRDCPPESYTLYDLGRRFAEFLEANRPDRDAEMRESWIDFVVDLARFERAVFATFDGPGAEDMTLAEVDASDADLKAQPSLSVDAYRFAVSHYYHQVREKADPGPPPEQQTFVAIVRKDYLTSTIVLSQVEYFFLGAMVAGASVEDALVISARASGTPLAEIRQAWSSKGGTRDAWIEAGFFVYALGDDITR